VIDKKGSFRQPNDGSSGLMLLVVIRIVFAFIVANNLALQFVVIIMYKLVNWYFLFELRKKERKISLTQ